MFPDDMPPGEAIRQITYAYRFSHALHAAAALGVADALADGPKTVEVIARTIGAHAPSLHRVLRALATIDVFAQDDAGHFRLTPRAELLRRDLPGSLRDLVLLMADGSEAEQASAAMAHSARTGEPGFDHVFGQPYFDYLAQNPDASARFSAGMSSSSGEAAAAIATAYDFAGLRAIVDVGGGRGALLAAILRANPHLHGVLFDQPHVVADAEPILTAAGVAARCEVVGGDFFATVPAGADAYILRYIVHDWDDERAAAILRSCRDAIPAHGRLLLAELVIPEGDGFDWGKWLDLTMLTLLGSRERTATEFQALLAAAGFELKRILPTTGPLSLIEAVPSP